MSPLSLIVAAFLAGMAIAGPAAWKVQAWRQDSNLHRQQLQASETSAKTARTTFRLHEVRDAESMRIADRLADALERLRNRPDRLPAAATAACAGATGAQLSGPDGGFLEREAARADQLRSALGECYGWIDAVSVRGIPPETTR